MNVWENNREAGYLRRQGAHYNVIVMDFVTGSYARASAGTVTTKFPYAYTYWGNDTLGGLTYFLETHLDLFWCLLPTLFQKGWIDSMIQK